MVVIANMQIIPRFLSTITHQNRDIFSMTLYSQIYTDFPCRNQLSVINQTSSSSYDDKHLIYLIQTTFPRKPWLLISTPSIFLNNLCSHRTDRVMIIKSIDASISFPKVDPVMIKTRRKFKSTDHHILTTVCKRTAFKPNFCPIPLDTKLCKAAVEGIKVKA